MAERLPFSSLMTAVVSRLNSDLTPTKTYAFIPQGTAKPYIEIGSITSSPSELKGIAGYSAGVRDVVTEFSVYSLDPSQVEVNSKMDTLLRALTRGGIALGDDFKIQMVREDGVISLSKGFDGIDLFWQGVIRIKWTILDLRAGG